MNSVLGPVFAVNLRGSRWSVAVRQLRSQTDLVLQVLCPGRLGEEEGLHQTVTQGNG